MKKSKNVEGKKTVMILSFVAVFLILLFSVVYNLNKILKSNRQVSLFSWNMELTEQNNYEEKLVPVKELGVTRIYQLLPAEYLSNPKLPIMIQSLHDEGIEMDFLTGDVTWLTDGLDEYKQIIDGIAAYNKSVKEELAITKVVLDVEAHTTKEWQEEPKECFQNYINLMAEAKSYANERGLQVIQVIPVSLDETDEKLFKSFLMNCCDELSIMNYNKKTAITAIETEVSLCKEYNIPVESVFETMPVDKEHGVTEKITYYYDGIDAMTDAGKKLQKKYGSSLGIGYHHYTTVCEMEEK